jgi:lantibiotic modifying enzyme
LTSDAPEVDRAVRGIAGRLRAAPPAEDHGLLTGEAGRVLFFLYFARYTGEPADRTDAESRLGRLFDTLPDTLTFTFCSGMAGIAWLLRHAGGSGLVAIEPEEPLRDIDAQLRQRMVEEMRAGRFDYLHGAFGIALYLLEAAGDPANRDALAAALLALDQHAMADGDRLHWRNPLLDEFAETRGGISLGLAHGMPGIISLLQRFVEAGVDAGRATRLRDGALAYVQAQANGPEAPSCFPTVVLSNNDRYSRVAWCYGDPGVAVALWHAGRHAAARAVLDHAASRRAPEHSGVTDLSLCHGSAGLALTFQRAAQWTGSPVLHDAARYWLDDTLARVAACEDTSLLTGLPGAGLALMAASGRASSAWDRALLLS